MCAAGLKAAPATHRNHFKQNIALELGQSAYRNGVSLKARNSDGAARQPGLRSPFKKALEQLEIAQSAGLGLVSAPGIRALYTQGQVYEAQAKADQGGWQGSAKSALAIAAWEEVIGPLERAPELEDLVAGLREAAAQVDDLPLEPGDLRLQLRQPGRRHDQAVVLGDLVPELAHEPVELAALHRDEAVGAALVAETRPELVLELVEALVPGELVLVPHAHVLLWHLCATR